MPELKNIFFLIAISSCSFATQKTSWNRQIYNSRPPRTTNYFPQQHQHPHPHPHQQQHGLSVSDWTPLTEPCITCRPLVEPEATGTRHYPGLIQFKPPTRQIHQNFAPQQGSNYFQSQILHQPISFTPRHHHNYPIPVLLPPQANSKPFSGPHQYFPDPQQQQNSNPIYLNSPNLLLNPNPPVWSITNSPQLFLSPENPSTESQRPQEELKEKPKQNSAADLKPGPVNVNIEENQQPQIITGLDLPFTLAPPSQQPLTTVHIKPLDRFIKQNGLQNSSSENLRNRDLEKEEIQLLYVPVETLRQRINFQQKNPLSSDSKLQPTQISPEGNQFQIESLLYHPQNLNSILSTPSQEIGQVKTQTTPIAQQLVQMPQHSASTPPPPLFFRTLFPFEQQILPFPHPPTSFASPDPSIPPQEQATAINEAFQDGPKDQKTENYQNLLTQSPFEQVNPEINENLTTVEVQTEDPSDKKTSQLEPHQPPLSIFLKNLNGHVKANDAVNEFKEAQTVVVLDHISNYVPKIFIGPANLRPPVNYEKLELPYLSDIEKQTSKQNINNHPFFVAPLDFNPPVGYSKVLFPFPHVGSIVFPLEEAKQSIEKDTIYNAEPSTTVQASVAELINNLEPQTTTITTEKPTSPRVRSRGSYRPSRTSPGRKSSIRSTLPTPTTTPKPEESTENAPEIKNHFKRRNKIKPELGKETARTSTNIPAAEERAHQYDAARLGRRRSGPRNTENQNKNEDKQTNLNELQETQSDAGSRTESDVVKKTRYYYLKKQPVSRYNGSRIRPSADLAEQESDSNKNVENIEILKQDNQPHLDEVKADSFIREEIVEQPTESQYHADGRQMDYNQGYEAYPEENEPPPVYRNTIRKTGPKKETIRKVKQRPDYWTARKNVPKQNLEYSEEEQDGPSTLRSSGNFKANKNYASDEEIYQTEKKRFTASAEDHTAKSLPTRGRETEEYPEWNPPESSFDVSQIAFTTSTILDLDQNPRQQKQDSKSEQEGGKDAFEPEIKKKKERRFRMRVHKRIHDNFEAAESQNSGAVSNTLVPPTPTNEQENFFQIKDQEIKKLSAEEMKSNLTNKANEANSSSEYKEDVDFRDENSQESTKTVVEATTTGSDESGETTTTTDDLGLFETTTDQATSDEPETESAPTESSQKFHNQIIKTLTTTQVSQETELCYRGKCIKSSLANPVPDLKMLVETSNPQAQDAPSSR